MIEGGSVAQWFKTLTAAQKVEGSNPPPDEVFSKSFLCHDRTPLYTVEVMSACDGD